MSTSATRDTGTFDPSSDSPMTHRQSIEALVGPAARHVRRVPVVDDRLQRAAEIITDLDGSQDPYTWVVTATLLASTATTPSGASSPTCSARSCWYS